MKLTDLVTLVNEYEQATWSPSRMEVRLGCECGCGGDSYTSESYEEEEQEAERAINRIKHFCIKYNIDYDGV